MREYKIQGLSCANCAADMENQVKQLHHGEDSEIKFNSSKLIINEEVDIQRVRSILQADGAALVEDINEEQPQSKKWPWFVILSAGIFGLTFIMNPVVPGSVLILMYALAMGISGWSTFIKGAKNLIKLKFTMDTLMTIALVGAVAIGEWREATIVAILFGLNEYLEGLGMEKARHSMEKLLEAAPKQATRVDRNGIETVVSINDLRKKDIVLVKAGEKIPSDGVILTGSSSVNEAAITGESLPVEKSTGDQLYGGSINNEGLLKVEITTLYKDSSLAKILHLVEEAQEMKTPTELFINKFSKYYTPAIMLVSLLVMILPPLFFGGEWGTWVYQGLAVLIVGCPCALILSSPIAIVSGITKNARNGILVKGGVFLEQLGKIDTIAFDKTGTLTKGKPVVQQVIVYDEEIFYSTAGAIEKNSSHPIAQAVMNKAAEHTDQFNEPDSLTAVPGEGMQAMIDGKRYWAGNEKLVEHVRITEQQQEDIEKFKNEGFTLVILAAEDSMLGVFGIADEIREESRSLIQQLHASGIKNTVMLTGDHQATAEKVASQIGVTHVFSGLLPDQKVDQIRELSRHSKVAMVGDGINDAPALAAADLGIAMGKGTDSAIETADLVLMQDHLGKLPEAVKIAKHVNRVIKLNLGLALGLKLFALLLTIPGLLTLWVAILADMGATILVTLISLTVLLQKKPANRSVQVDEQLV